MGTVRYTDEQVAAAVANSTSISGAVRLLGIPVTGGSHGNISNRIKKLGLDTSHYNPTGRGATHPAPRKTPDDILIVLPVGSARPKAEFLRRALLEIGTPHACAECGLSKWYGQEITLEIDHVDGNFLNNIRSNLRFLCPNCHTQTDGFAGRSKDSHKARRLPSKICECGNLIKTKKAKECSRCSLTRLTNRPTKIEWPPIEELVALLAESNYSAVGRSLGVTDNAVRKYVSRRTILV